MHGVCSNLPLDYAAADRYGNSGFGGGFIQATLLNRATTEGCHCL